MTLCNLILTAAQRLTWINRDAGSDSASRMLLSSASASPESNGLLHSPANVRSVETGKTCEAGHEDQRAQPLRRKWTGALELLPRPLAAAGRLHPRAARARRRALFRSARPRRAQLRDVPPAANRLLGARCRVRPPRQARNARGKRAACRPNLAALPKGARSHRARLELELTNLSRACKAGFSFANQHGTTIGTRHGEARSSFEAGLFCLKMARRYQMKDYNPR